MTSPLETREGEHYTNLVQDDLNSVDIENIYHITSKREGYINHTIDAQIIYKSIYFYNIELEEALDRWKNRLYNVSSRRFMCIKKHVF